MILALLLLAADVTKILPEVHSVNVEGEYVVIRSAGISRLYLGPLQSNPVPGNTVNDFTFRIPRVPHAAAHHVATPTAIMGVFFNGVPIYNQFQTSYQGRNLWHYDPAAARDQHANVPGMLEKMAHDDGKHSPLIGYALDGFPVYGPWGASQRMHSSYRLRNITRRTSWADGTQLTASQAGPAIDEDNPLGTFAEDYEYVAGSGDLDEFNGRFAVTPEYPNGTYAYFLSTDTAGRLAYPYIMSSRYYGEVPATATAPSTARVAGQPTQLTFDMPRVLEYVHERPIHLIVVSEDLAEFDHIHPERNGDRWEVTYIFRHGGHYRAYADFTPPGGEQTIESFDYDVIGSPRGPVLVAARQSSLRSSLTLKIGAPLRAGHDIPLRFAIADRTGVEPYLGAWAHFVVIQEGLGSFQHAHPIEGGMAMTPGMHCAMATGDPPAEIKTVVNFAKPGRYKLWAQFQRAGQVITTPFVLQIAPAATPAIARAK
jgi:hypothetical protein